MRKYALPPLATFDVRSRLRWSSHRASRCRGGLPLWGGRDRAWAVKFTSHDANKITGVPLDIESIPRSCTKWAS